VANTGEPPAAVQPELVQGDDIRPQSVIPVYAGAPDEYLSRGFS
jgi:hypothetical protein